MNTTELKHLCDRLTARFDRAEPTRFALIDIATVLVFVRRHVESGHYQHHLVGRQARAASDLGVALSWIQAHGAGASTEEIRTHVVTALTAANIVVSALLLHPLPVRNQPRSHPEAGQGLIRSEIE